MAKFLELAREHEFGKIVAHAPYTLNACAVKENLREFAKETFADDLKRMEFTPEITIISTREAMWDRESRLESRRLRRY